MVKKSCVCSENPAELADTIRIWIYCIPQKWLLEKIAKAVILQWLRPPVSVKPHIFVRVVFK